MSTVVQTLTAERVTEVLKYCLFTEAEMADESIIKTDLIVKGVVLVIGLHPGRVAEKTEEISELLSQLPDEFMKDTGGGMSFLKAPFRKDHSQWGEQFNAEELLVLGLASGKVEYCLPREVWGALPGGVPYFMVT